MRSWRLWYWIGGLLASLALATAVPWGEGSREIGPPLVFLAWALLGLAGEVISLLASLAGGHGRESLAESRPADGTIERARLAGVRSEPNPIDPRFGRFLALEPDADEDARPGRVATRPGRQSPPLLGRIAVISVFIGRDHQPWSDAEIARIHRALERAALWIESEAARWGANVNIELAETYFAAEDPEDEEVAIAVVSEGLREGLFEADAVARAMASASRAAVGIGFEGVADLIERITPRLSADRVVWLLHPRREGRSLAIPDDQTLLPGVVLAVCYARYADFPGPLIVGEPSSDPATLAHEFLHLFGATDKYGQSLRRFPRGTVTPHDVMRMDHSSLSRLRVDPLTALEVGWADRGRLRAEG